MLWWVQRLQRQLLRGVVPRRKFFADLVLGDLVLLHRSSNTYSSGGSTTRPNGPAEQSPGLRPQADALGKETINRRGLKGRESRSRSRCQSSEVLAALQAARIWVRFPRASACG